MLSFSRVLTKKVEKIISMILLYERMTKYFGFFQQILEIYVIFQENSKNNNFKSSFNYNVKKMLIFSRVLTSEKNVNF